MNKSVRIHPMPARSPMAIAVAVALMAGAPLAQAATFNVNTTIDGVDASPGNGVCLTTANACSLRAAIMEANALAGGPHTINLPEGTYTLTLTGAAENAAATGDLDINRSLNIVGSGPAGTIVEAGAGFGDRVFDIGPVTSGLTVQFFNFRIRNGQATSIGGGVLVNSESSAKLQGMVVTGNSSGDAGGGIANYGTLTVSETTVSSNTATNESGGIYSNGPLSVWRGTISGNSTVGGNGGGIGVYDSLDMPESSVTGNTANDGNGGGLYINSNSAVTLNNVTVSGNDANGGDAGNGGGIYFTSFGGSIDTTNSRINTNTAGSSGGGLYVSGPATVTTTTVNGNTSSYGGGIYNSDSLTLTRSTVSGNTANSYGGGIYQVSTASITNSTLSGNRALGGGSNYGGGIWVEDDTNLTNVTIANTIAGGGLGLESGTVNTLNTLIVNNTGGDCTGDESNINNLGGNRDRDDTCKSTTPAFDFATDASPLIGPLQDNGGPTRTHALLGGSPAIDAGLAAGCPGSDQRGQSRPQGPGCDVGAFEVGVPEPDGNGGGPGPTPPTDPVPPGPPAPPPPPPGPPNLGGNPIWISPPGLNTGSSGEGMAVDGGGLTAVGFAVDGGAVLSADALAGGTTDLVVRRYSFNGQLLWSRGYDSGGDDYGYGVTKDAQDRITVAGYSVKGPVTSAIALQYDTAGNQKWLKTIESGLAAAYNVAAGTDGTLYVVGERHNGKNFDLLLVALNPDGSEKWRLVHDAGGDETGYGVALAPEGIYAVGARDQEKWGCLVTYAGAVDYCHSAGFPGVIYQAVYDATRGMLFVGGSIDRATRDAWVARFNPQTRLAEWIRIHDGGGEDLVRGLTLRDGFLFATGRVFNPVDGADLFAVALDPDSGESGMPFLYNSGQFDSGHGIGLDAQGHLYVGGVSGDGFVVMQVPGGAP